MDTPATVAPEPTAPTTAPETPTAQPQAAPAAAPQKLTGTDAFRAKAAAAIAALPQTPLGDLRAEIQAQQEAHDAQVNGAAWDAAAGRFRAPDGTFTAPPAEQPAAPDASAAPPAPTETSPGAEAAPAAGTDAPEAQAIVVPLTGRNGETIELEVADPDAAEAIRALKNDGLRKQELTRRLAGVEQKEAEYREFAAMVQTAPEMLVDEMAPAVRARFMNYLLATSFDQVRPMLEQWYTDDLARREAMLTMRDQTAQAKQQYQTRLAAERREADVLRAVSTLVPESASPEDAADFQRVAIATLSAEVQAKGDIDPRQVPALLERDLRRFGWMPPAEPSRTTTPSLLATSPARAPVSAPAAPASPRPAPTAPATVQAQRQAAAPVVPAGTGAAPVAQAPRVASFKDASRLLRRMGQWGTAA